jgi:hypothetical protein
MAISDLIRKEASLPSGDLKTVMSIVKEFVHQWSIKMKGRLQSFLMRESVDQVAADNMHFVLDLIRQVFSDDMDSLKYTKPYLHLYPNIREEVLEMLPIPRIKMYVEVCLINEMKAMSKFSTVASIQNLAEEIKTSAGIGKPLTGPPPKNRNPVVQGLIERGGAGAGYHADSDKKKDTRRDRQDTKKKIRQNPLGD